MCPSRPQVLNLQSLWEKEERKVSLRDRKEGKWVSLLRVILWAPFQSGCFADGSKEDGGRNVNMRLFGEQRASLTRWQRTGMGSASSGNGERGL